MCNADVGIIGSSTMGVGGNRRGGGCITACVCSGTVGWGRADVDSARGWGEVESRERLRIGEGIGTSRDRGFGVLSSVSSVNSCINALPHRNLFPDHFSSECLPSVKSRTERESCFTVDLGLKEGRLERSIGRSAVILFCRSCSLA